MTIFQAGGALYPNHSTYVERDADSNLMRIVEARQFAYIIAPRQIGKTSLLRQLKPGLLERGWHYCYIDLSTLIGFDQLNWYKNIGALLSPILTPQTHPIIHDQIELQLYLTNEVLGQFDPPIKVALILDEVEGTAKLPFSSEFFSTLRSMYNVRDSYNGHFVVILAGNINPKQLIKNPETSPFNVSQEIVLRDFTCDQTRQLTENLYRLGVPIDETSHERIYDWTSGHPYLTQRLCSILESLTSTKKIYSVSPKEIDWVVESIILNPMSLDSNLGHINKGLMQLSKSVIKSWQKIVTGEYVSITNENGVELCLLGAAKIDTNDDKVIIRNEIYNCMLKREKNPDENEAPKHHQEVVPVVKIELLTDIIPTAFCRQLKAQDFPLIKVIVDNSKEDSDNIIVRVEIFIEDYSDKAVETKNVAKREKKEFPMLPVFKQAAIADLSEIRPVTLRVIVEQKSPINTLLFDNTFPVILHAKNTVLLAVTSHDNQQIDLTDYLATWITPHHPEIEELLREAVNYHPSRCFLGYQGASSLLDAAYIVRLQAKAIFDVLKNKINLTYIDSSWNFGTQDGQFMQRVRLPTDCLRSGGSANCIDGTVLFASLLEIASIEPIIVLVPGHAFVGWRVLPDKEIYEFLETTKIGYSEFDAAQEDAKAKYDDAIFKSSKNQGFIRIIDVKACRKKGIYPLE
jgi:hypothetical protein